MKSIKDIWWLYLVTGIVSIIFGIVLLVVPEISLAFLVALFGVFTIIVGILAIVRSVSLFRVDRSWWVVLLEGLFAFAIGLLVIFYPINTTIVLLYFIGVWATITGIWEISCGIRYRKLIKNEYYLILIGIISIIFGGILFIKPFIGAFTLIALVAFFSLLRGISSTAFAIRLKKFQD